MIYLCLGYYDPAAYDALSDAEREELARVCGPMDDELRATDRLRSVASLAHRASKVLRPSGDGPAVTDGPFAETKEVVGSFFVVEADGLEEAVEIASLHPAARWGEHLGWAVEVRPIERLEVRDERDPREERNSQGERDQRDQGGGTMRFMMLMIPGGYEDADPGAVGELDPEAVAAMTAYNEELEEAGVLLDLNGLHPPSRGTRVSFEGDEPSVTDGPFAGAKEVVGGYWMIEVDSKEEAVEWAKRCPASENEVIEIRRVQEMEDYSNEVREIVEGSSRAPDG